MKKKIISLIGIALVIICVVIGVKYFRNGNPFEAKPGEGNPEAFIPDEDKDTPVQTGKPDEESKKLAELLKSQTGMEYDPNNIVSTGNPIVQGKISYMVNSWEVQKEYPGYALPEGKTPLNEYPGAEVDEEGNITNDFSYVVVNVTVENLKDEDVTALFWGYFTLGIINGDGDYSGEVTYLGENTPRKEAKDYNQETIQANGKKEIALIFVVEDELIDGKQLYIKVNSSGAATVNPDYDVRRFIVLN